MDCFTLPKANGVESLKESFMMISWAAEIEDRYLAPILYIYLVNSPTDMSLYFQQNLR